MQWPFDSNEVEEIISGYPDKVQPLMLALRELIFETAEEVGVMEKLEETLKWGEPSYVCPTGSTFRIDWKKETPEYYWMFFHCQSLLVPTF